MEISSVKIVKRREPDDPELGLNEEEYKQCEEHCKYALCRVIIISATHPLTFARTLFQLGHEPYPLTTGKTYIFFGRNANYLPNVFQYLRNIYQSHGLKVMYTGVSSHVISTVANYMGSSAVSMYLNRYFPELGGDIRDLEKKEDEDETELDAYQAFRLKFREAIRASVAQIIGITISRPFAVIMVRQIAQHIGNEGKYARINPLQALLRIGDEEGPVGLFSGIIPSIIGGLVGVWATATLSYAVDRAFKNIEKDQDEEIREHIGHMRKAMDLVVSFGVNTLKYPFEVVSTVMAVNGSGLFVSMLPYSPVFPHWSDYYNYLKPYELTRGAKIIMREERGPVKEKGNMLYASKMHFM